MTPSTTREALRLSPRNEVPADHGGRVSIERRFGDCELREVCFEPGRRLERHAHTHGTITYVIRGGFEESYEGEHEPASCRAPCVVVKAPGRAHAELVGSDGARVLVASIREPLWRTWVASDRRVDGPIHLDSGECLLIADRLHAELRSPGPGSDLIVVGLASQLAGACVSAAAQRRRGHPSPWLDEVMAIVSRDFRRTLSVKGLAKRAGVHPDHLSRRFRAHYGTSLVRFLRHQRVRWAAEEIARSDRSLAEITTLAGFSDQSHFTRAFKRELGITPGQYRRATRGARRRGC